jgi:hypothetical protein
VAAFTAAISVKILRTSLQRNWVKTTMADITAFKVLLVLDILVRGHQYLETCFR